MEITASFRERQKMRRYVCTSRTPSPSETVEPDPTPAPVLAPPPQPVYGSLREVGDPGYPVLLDGNLLETVYAAGVLLLNQEEYL